MKNKETGEFELVVGNGVLLSGFFIVVLLFSVAFAMGFIVARAKYQPDALAAGTTATPVTQATETRPAASSPAPAPTPTSDATQQPAEPHPTTQPAADPAAAAAQPAGVTPQDKQQSKDPNAPVPEAPPGLYWQVTSIPDIQAARIFLKTVEDMGLKATLSPGPAKFTRVLVGPYPDTAALAKVKTQLENAGMHPVRHNQL